MKITIYELLGMIKEGKTPKKIKFNEIYCYYRECKNEYVDYTNKPIIQWDYVVMNSLNDEVEILEEPKGIPKKIDIIGWDKCIYGVTTKEKELAIEIKKTQKLLNQVLDYLKSKGE